MGLFHCIESSCARVEYQEYLPPMVRWRYPGEEWQEIEADDYNLISKSGGQCPVSYSFATAACVYDRFGGGYFWRNIKGIFTDEGPIDNIRIEDEGTGTVYTGIVSDSSILNNTDPAYGYDTEFLNTGLISISSSSNVFVKWTANGIEQKTSAPNGGGFRLFNFRRTDNQLDDCENCEFTVYKDGLIVYQNTAAECPEVEQLPCRLSGITKVINIDKLPFLERVEVRKESINIISIGFPLSYPTLEISPLTEECLNIYLTATPASPFPQDNIPIPTFVNPYLFIAQICSADGCPPPAYQVICECCEHCPDNTCPVKCEGHICCYDEQGIAVKQIDSTAYCEV